MATDYPQSGDLPRSSGSHRLPTVSASGVLAALKSRGPTSISTGLKRLDQLLRPSAVGTNDAYGEDGGIVRGQVTEIYGPPGVGKTTLAAQICANALKEGNHIVWVDASYALVKPRFDKIVQHAVKSDSLEPSSLSQPLEDVSQRVHSFQTPTLAHLLALFIQPPTAFPPPGTSVIIIDSLSTLFDNAYPRNGDERSQVKKNEATRWVAGRRFAVMNELMSKLGKLAAVHKVAIIFTCQTVSRIRTGRGALLGPALNGAVWDAGLHTRLVLFRDWVMAKDQVQQSGHKKQHNVRMAGVTKAGRMSRAAEKEENMLVAFTINETGVHEVNITTDELPLQQLTSPARPLKRPFSDIDDDRDREGTDSEDPYEWVEEDEIAAEGLLVNETALETETARSIKEDNAPQDSTVQVTSGEGSADKTI